MRIALLSTKESHTFKLATGLATKLIRPRIRATSWILLI